MKAADDQSEHELNVDSEVLYCDEYVTVTRIRLIRERSVNQPNNPTDEETKG